MDALLYHLETHWWLVAIVLIFVVPILVALLIYGVVLWWYFLKTLWSGLRAIFPGRHNRL